MSKLKPLRITVLGVDILLDKPVTIKIGKKKLQEVLDESPKRIIVTDIGAMTDVQINALRCGDVVLKEDSTGQHAYLVSFRSATGICLTYTDCENVETVAYDKTDDGWVYNSTDVTHIAS